jgi:hypothetical protein
MSRSEFALQRSKSIDIGLISAILAECQWAGRKKVTGFDLIAVMVKHYRHHHHGNNLWIPP